MFRTVVVNFGEKISVKDNLVVVTAGDEDRRIPLEDIYSIVIDNPITCITAPAITKLTDNGTHILVCNEKHLPVSIILPQNNHYRPLNVIRKQIDMSVDFKNQLWDKIIKAKIINQSKTLKLCGCKKEIYNRFIVDRMGNYIYNISVCNKEYYYIAYKKISYIDYDNN